MPFIWHQMAWKNLADFEHPTWKGKSIKTSHNHWAKYTYIWFHIKTTIEYYTQVPLSTMLKCHWVLCSSAFEYYTQVPLSTILKCHWILCSSAIEYYAIYGIECYLWIRLWVHEIIFLLKTSYFIAPKNDVAI